MTSIETISSISVIIFGATLVWMIRIVRKSELEYVKNALTNPLWPRTDFRFFISIYRNYFEITHSKVIIVINLISLVIVFVGLFYTVLDY